MPGVEPPQLVGSRVLADIYGVTQYTVRDGLREDREPYTIGYVGTISGRHVWNLNEILDFGGGPCRIDGCDEPAGLVGFCVDHATKFATAWSRAERSRVARLQLIAMARWIVERYGDMFDPWPDGDVWGDGCMTPDCENDPAKGSPLCRRCERNLFRRITFR